MMLSKCLCQLSFIRYRTLYLEYFMTIYKNTDDIYIVNYRHGGNNHKFMQFAKYLDVKNSLIRLEQQKTIAILRQDSSHISHMKK